MWVDTIRLSFEHSLVIPNAPDIIPLSTVVQKHASGMEIKSMGLFDTAAPNFSNYYPDVKTEDFTPKDEEFIYPIYRALSQVIVHKNYNPVDFGEGNVLKNSMVMLKGQTVYPNHEAAVGNELGAIMDVAWEQSYKSEEGFKVPAGINAKLKIDGKSNPKIARGINMNPPSIHSTSVTVEFLWVKSHPSMTEEEFWRSLGTHDADGKLIRKIASKIRRYSEISFVSKGADPYAQKVGKDGEIVNPREADIRSNKELAKTQKFFVFDCCHEILSNEDTIPEETINEHHKNSQMNKTFLLALAASMKLTGDQYTEANITEEIIRNAVAQRMGELTQATTTNTSNEAELTRLRGIETSYNAIKGGETRVTELTSFKEGIVTKLREKVKTTYTKLSGDKSSETVLNMIKDASYEVLLGLDEQYSTQLEEKYPASCKKCGSKDISRASSKPSKEDEGSGEEGGEDKLDEMIRKKKRESNLAFGDRAGKSKN